jgi:hypothetical protein
VRIPWIQIIERWQKRTSDNERNEVVLDEVGVGDMTRYPLE